MFRFHISALPWLAKIWSSTSALSFCIDCQKCEVLLPHPHFRSAFTAKYVKFCSRASALPLLAKIWSSAFRTCSAWTSKSCEVPLPHFISAWTSKDLQFRFCTFAQSWLPKIWRSASPLTLCLHCQIWEVPPPHFPSALTAKICSFTFQICLHSQRCERTSALPPQFRCGFILYIFTQFRAVLHEGLTLQRDEASLFASKKSKPSNSHLVKFKRFLHVSECNLASTWKIAEQYIQWHWRSVPMVIDNNYTLSVYCCVDIIISLNGYCTCTDADDM